MSTLNGKSLLESLETADPSAVVVEDHGGEQETPGTPASLMPVSAYHLAEEVLEKCSHKLLMVGDREEEEIPWPLWRHRSGRWVSGPRPWSLALGKMLGARLEDAYAVLNDDDSKLRGAAKQIERALLHIQNTKEKESIHKVRERLFTAIEQSGGYACNPRVEHCTPEDLDADGKFIGTSGGILNIKTGEIMDPGPASQLRVTCSTSCLYVPEAYRRTFPLAGRQQTVEQILFGHIRDEELVDFIKRVIGTAMYGKPARRFFVIQGVPGGGKTTLANILDAALGRSYVTHPNPTTLTASKDASSHQTGTGMYCRPARFALLDEPSAPKGGFATEKLKQFSGDTRAITFRDAYARQPVTALPTATMFFFCNQSSTPVFDMADDGIKARLIVIPYPRIEKQDTGLLELMSTDKFREAALSFLVEQSSRKDVERGEWPKKLPDPVKRATVSLAYEELGELGDLTDQFIKTSEPADHYFSDDLWDKWRELQGIEEGDPAKTVAYYTKVSLGKAFRKHFSLGRPVLRRKEVPVPGGGTEKKQLRAMVGIRLRTPEEMTEQQQVQAILREAPSPELAYDDAFKPVEETFKLTEPKPRVEVDWSRCEEPETERDREIRMKVEKLYGPQRP